MIGVRFVEVSGAVAAAGSLPVEIIPISDEDRNER